MRASKNPSSKLPAKVSELSPLPLSPPDQAQRDYAAEILECISDVFYSVDPNFNFTFVNRNAEEVWGKKREDLLGRNCWTEFPAEVGGESHRAHQQVMETREALHLETLSPTLERHVSVGVYPSRDGGLAVYLHDRDQQRRAEAELESLEAAQRAILDSADHSILLIAPNYEVQLFNQAAARNAERVYGGPMRRGESILAYVAPEDQPSFQQNFARALCGEQVSVEKQIQGVQDKSWWEFFYYPIALPSGEVTGVTFTARDITNRKQAEEALRQSEAQMRDLADAVPHQMWISPPQGGVQYYNRRFYEFTGLSLEEAEGSGWSKIVHPDDLPYCLSTRKRAIGQQVPWVYNYRLRRWDGVWCWHRGRAVPVRDPETGELVRWVGTATDIDDEVKAAEALQRANDDLETRVAERTEQLARTNELRQELLRRLVNAQEEERGRISRELHDETGQDVTALLLGLSNLKAALPDNAEARNTVARLEAITAELAKKSHRLAFNLRPTALDDIGLVAALQNYTQEWMRWTQITVELAAIGFDDVPRLPSEIETTVYRVVQESLTNVLRHASAARRVGVILQRRAQLLVVTVDDAGPGFDVDAALHLPPGQRRLGLFGMQERATLVGGTFAVESKPGEGATVLLRIPL